MLFSFTGEHIVPSTATKDSEAAGEIGSHHLVIGIISRLCIVGGMVLSSGHTQSLWQYRVLCVWVVRSLRMPDESKLVAFCLALTGTGHSLHKVARHRKTSWDLALFLQASGSKICCSLAPSLAKSNGLLTPAVLE